jgi:hypothetical protein
VIRSSPKNQLSRGLALELAAILLKVNYDPVSDLYLMTSAEEDCTRSGIDAYVGLSVRVVVRHGRNRMIPHVRDTIIKTVTDATK